MLEDSVHISELIHGAVRHFEERLIARGIPSQSVVSPKCVVEQSVSRSKLWVLVCVCGGLYVVTTGVTLLRASVHKKYVVNENEKCEFQQSKDLEGRSLKLDGKVGHDAVGTGG